MTNRYKIIFSGKPEDGWGVDTVKDNLAQLLKLNEEKITVLFSGKPFVIAKNLDGKRAGEYQAVLKKNGAESVVKKMGHHESAPEADKKKIAESENPGSAKLSKEEEKLILAKSQMIAMMYQMDNKKKKRDPRKLFKWIRIGALFLVLLVTSQLTLMASGRIAGWEEPLNVVIYPINGDGAEETGDYINSLEVDVFKPIEDFMSYEAESFDFKLDAPVTAYLADEVSALPPEPPRKRSALSAIWWSLNMRYWAFMNGDYDGPKDIRIFVIYKSLREYVSRVEISAGLKKGLIGVVYASPVPTSEAANNIIIAHEMLHTFGAKDKYNLETMKPDYPDGYGDPDKRPLYPQDYGEIMAIRIPKTETSCWMPRSLDDLVINKKTSIEIHWFEEEDF